MYIAKPLRGRLAAGQQLAHSERIRDQATNFSLTGPVSHNLCLPHLHCPMRLLQYSKSGELSIQLRLNVESVSCNFAAKSDEALANVPYSAGAAARLT